MTSRKAQRGHEAQAAAQPATHPQDALDQAMAEVASDTDAALDRLRGQHPPQAAARPVHPSEIQALIDADEAMLERLRSADPVPFMAEARIRWDVVTCDVDDHGKDINAKAMDRLHDGVRYICSRMVTGLGPAAEDWLLQDVVDEVIWDLQRRAIEYAARVLARRAIEQAPIDGVLARRAIEQAPIDGMLDARLVPGA